MTEPTLADVVEMMKAM
jgi:hypothetical protein